MELVGTVLMDNTTIYGAKYAYEAWPPTERDWFQEPNSCNLRALMDVLEAIVLYDHIIVDATSRGIFSDGAQRWESVWHALEALKADDRSPILVNRFLLSPGSTAMHPPRRPQWYCLRSVHLNSTSIAGSCVARARGSSYRG
jgi:hypothetical protein